MSDQNLAEKIPARLEADDAYRVASRNHAVAGWVVAIGAVTSVYWWLIATLGPYVTRLFEPLEAVFGG